MATTHTAVKRSILDIKQTKLLRVLLPNGECGFWQCEWGGGGASLMILQQRMRLCRQRSHYQLSTGKHCGEQSRAAVYISQAPLSLIIQLVLKVTIPSRVHWTIQYWQFLAETELLHTEESGNVTVSYFICIYNPRLI